MEIWCLIRKSGREIGWRAKKNSATLRSIVFDFSPLGHGQCFVMLFWLFIWVVLPGHRRFERSIVPVGIMRGKGVALLFALDLYRRLRTRPSRRSVEYYRQSVALPPATPKESFNVSSKQLFAVPDSIIRPLSTWDRICEFAELRQGEVLAGSYKRVQRFTSLTQE